MYTWSIIILFFKLLHTCSSRFLGGKQGVVIPIVVWRVTSRGTVFSVLGIVKELVADWICKRIAKVSGNSSKEGFHLINGLQGTSFLGTESQHPIPEQDPTHYSVPSPSRDPTPNRVPTPVNDSFLIQDPTPVEDPNPTVNPIPVRSPSPAAQCLSNQVEQDFARFIKWKLYRTAPYDVLFNWKEWREEEEFILSVTDSKEILLLILLI
ncbi:hypothetical protein OROMI_027816 [Orobanche minor]